MASIRTAQDERNQHVVLVDGRVYARNASLAIASATAAALRRDIARHGEAVVDLAALPVAQYRVTKAGRRLLLS